MAAIKSIERSVGLTLLVAAATAYNPAAHVNLFAPVPAVAAPAAPLALAASAATARCSILRLCGPPPDDATTTFLYYDEIAEKAPCLASTLERVRDDADVLRLLAESDAQMRKVTPYLRPSQQKTVRLALEVGLLAHHGQARRSGDPFITHPVAVASILATNNMEAVTVISGLMHDTVEDTCLTFEDVETLFGFTVRRIVEGETKVSKLPKMVRSHLDTEVRRSKVEEQVENMRSMFIAMADDWRIVVASSPIGSTIADIAVHAAREARVDRTRDAGDLLAVGASSRHVAVQDGAL